MAAKRNQPPRPPQRGRRWTSFVAAEGRGRVPRMLHEESHPQHRLRVEHDQHTLLIHLSNETDDGWTTIAIDRATRQWAVAQGAPKNQTGPQAYDALYGPAEL